MVDKKEVITRKQNKLTSADGLPLVEEIEDVPGPLVVDLEDWPQCLHLKIVQVD